MKQHLIGISGKMGSGKNYLADRLVARLEFKGYTVHNASFAKALKIELDEIIEYLKTNKSYRVVLELADKFELGTLDAQFLYDNLIKDIKSDESLDAYSRTEGVRRSLQYLGTEVRRKVDDTYWLKAFHSSLPEDADFVLATDVRFPNEADSIRELGGTIIRINVTDEIISQRVAQRDSLEHSSEAKAHSSETAMDDYKKFDIVLEPDYDLEEVLTKLLSKASKQS